MMRTQRRASCIKCGKIFETRGMWYNRMFLRNVHETKVLIHYLRAHKENRLKAVKLIVKNVLCIPFKIILQFVVWIVEIIGTVFGLLSDICDNVRVALYQIGE